MIEVRFHPEAEEDLVDGERWYRERSEVAAQAFLLEIDGSLKQIAEAPLRWPTGFRGERRYVLDHFPYTIMYRARTNYVFVTAVAHESRRPGYWRHRSE